MKISANILIVIGFIIGVSSNLLGQTIDQYKILLTREKTEKRETYDTIAPIEYLCAYGVDSLKNMQAFEGFNYRQFKRNIKKKKTALYNDSIKIILTVVPFDSNQFIKQYRLDSSVYYNSLYFRDLPADFDYPPFFPKNEISEISITINKKKIIVPKQYSKNLYNPALQCWNYNGIEKCGVNGYVADNGKILLSLTCGEGVGAYIVILIFDQTGKIEKRIEEPVI